MTTVVLVRHGRTAANASGVLAGRSAGIGLDDVGRDQAARAASRLAEVPLAALVSSPLDRCLQTAGFIAEAQTADLAITTDDALTECDYGDWQGRSLGELVKEPLWAGIQGTPSTVTFPGGESMAGMQRRAVDAIRRLDAEVESAHGADAVWAAVSHGDIIKSILADALGMDFDQFQRIAVAPASISVIRLGASRPVVVMTGDLSGLRATAPVLGGGV